MGAIKLFFFEVLHSSIKLTVQYRVDNLVYNSIQGTIGYLNIEDEFDTLYKLANRDIMLQTLPLKAYNQTYTVASVEKRNVSMY